jgi:hypothetical protein
MRAQREKQKPPQNYAYRDGRESCSRLITWIMVPAALIFTVMVLATIPLIILSGMQIGSEALQDRAVAIRGVQMLRFVQLIFMSLASVFLGLRLIGGSAWEKKADLFLGTGSLLFAILLATLSFFYGFFGA